MSSHKEENYLKAIYKLAEKNNGLAANTAIAQTLNVSPATVSDMLKRLDAKKYIHYEKSKGIKLTQNGKNIAITIIRKHRLWETFLVNMLHFKWDEVHEIAEQLEHINSETLIERIDALLDYPKFDPHGDPIPDKNGRFSESKSILLTEKKAGSKCTLAGVADHSSLFRNYLDKIGLEIGDSFVIKSIEEFDKTFLIVLKNKKQIGLSQRVAGNLWITADN